MKPSNLAHGGAPRCPAAVGGSPPARRRHLGAAITRGRGAPRCCASAHDERVRGRRSSPADEHVGDDDRVAVRADGFEQSGQAAVGFSIFVSPSCVSAPRVSGASGQHAALCDSRAELVRSEIVTKASAFATRGREGVVVGVDSPRPTRSTKEASGRTDRRRRHPVPSASADRRRSPSGPMNEDLVAVDAHRGRSRQASAARRGSPRHRPVFFWQRPRPARTSCAVWWAGLRFPRLPRWWSPQAQPAVDGEIFQPATGRAGAGRHAALDDDAAPRAIARFAPPRPQ